ncbi:N-acetylglucosamine-6-phosphate deacetylase [Jannaschia sp. LMIT008]|uniref:N-acetylglucosamine-6-phosphate deacetylase n=1 Tax=Jannaschia maritima TaxID=3032585 RepID=UPI00281288EA|nr:N-acetylglucosamine-6-phosphate deacetylase [Jannaschia sp. LMIT008]
MTAPLAFAGGRVFDGAALHDGPCARFEGGTFHGLADAPRTGDRVVDLGGDVLSPGYVDLQVNGGGGVMLNADPSAAALARIARAHRTMGTVRILPTLITDTPAATAAAIDATRAAMAEGVSGIAGLHLEGPHLSIARKGAHDEGLIRPMTDADLAVLLRAKRDLPVLKVTVAPEGVTPDQTRAMAHAGILVSLGHTDAPFEDCIAHVAAGARCATHLFNAMSQLGSRRPGLVGAALTDGRLSAGLIADGLHVHPATMRAAWAAKAGPGTLFLVSDAMAVAGTERTGFDLGGRPVERRNGGLRLADGTLAGADLDLTRAVRILVERAGVPLADALAAATRGPAALAGMAAGRLVPGHTALCDVIRIRGDLSGPVPVP